MKRVVRSQSTCSRVTFFLCITHIRVKKQKGVYNKKFGPIEDRLGFRNAEQKKGKTYTMKDEIKEVARYEGYCVH